MNMNKPINFFAPHPIAWTDGNIDLDPAWVYGKCRMNCADKVVEKA